MQQPSHQPIHNSVAADERPAAAGFMAKNKKKEEKIALQIGFAHFASKTKTTFQTPFCCCSIVVFDWTAKHTQ